MVKAEAIARTLLAAALLGGVAAALPVQSAESPPPERNAILHVVPREVLFFSAQNGGWTSVRLEAGERVLRQGVGDNVALVVTDVRAIAFSAPLSVAAEVIVRASSEDAVETATTSGNAAAVITRRHAYGFSALTGRWTAVERFLPR
jgi:hypothetical protein